MNKRFSIIFFSRSLFLILIFKLNPGLFAQDFKQQDLDQIESVLDSGRRYFFEGNYEEALEKFYKAGEIAENINHKTYLGKCYNNIGAVYSSIGENDLALKYLSQSKNIKQELNDSAGLASTMINIAGIYQELNDYDKALKSYKKIHALMEQLEDTSGIAAILNNMGMIHFNKGIFEDAIIFFEQSLELSRLIDDQWSIASTLNNLAEVYIDLDNLNLTYSLLDASEIVIDEIKALDLAKESLEIRMKALAAQGRYKEAYKFNELYLAIKDSIINTEKAQNIVALEAKYESEKREGENELLKTEMEIREAVIQRQRIIFIVSSLLIIVLLVYSITLLRYNNLRKKAGALLREQKDEIEIQNITLENLNSELSHQNQEINKQKTELENLINVKDKLFSILSHDLRSPLNSLAGILHLIKQGLINKEEEKIYLTELDTKIGYTQHFIENMFQWSRSQLDGFTINTESFDIKELVVEAYNNFDMQAREKSIKLVNKVNQSVTVLADRNLTRITLGNFISNAIKFTPSGGEIIFRSELMGEKYKLSVQDTGLGMNKETVEKILSGGKIKTMPGTAEEMGSGLGLFIARDFIEKNKGIMLIDSHEGDGSTFSFTIPVQG